MKIDKEMLSSLQIIFTFIIARGFPAVINFLATTFYAHQLLPDDYGKYSLSILSATFISAWLFSWLNMALLRFYAENKEGKENFLYTIQQTFLFLALATCVLGIPLTMIVNKYLFTVILLSAAQSFFQLCLQLLVSETRPKRYALMASINSGLCFLLAYILITFFKLGELGIIVAMIVSNLVTAALLYFDNWHIKTKATFDFKLLSKCFRYGYPLSLSLIIGIVLYGLDRVMLNIFWGKQSVGLYSLPYDIANQSITIIFMAFQLYLYPQVIKLLHEQGSDIARQQLEKNGRLFLSLILPGMLILLFFSKQIGQLITGVQYHQAFTVVMPIIAVGAVLQGFKAYYYDLSFQLSHKTLIQLYINGFVILLNFMLNLLVIPKYDYLGAAYVSVFVSLVGLLLSYFYGKRHFHVPSLLVKKNLNYIFAAFLLSLTFWQIRQVNNLLLMVGLGLIVVSAYLVFVLLAATSNSLGGEKAQ